MTDNLLRDALTRRSLLAGSAATFAIGASGLYRRAVAAEPLTVGIVYVGPKEDSGWNEANAVGLAALKAEPGITVVEQENVPETSAVTLAMESMITRDGAKLILGAAFGYFDPFMIDLARAHPDVQFRHPTTLWRADQHPANLGGYAGYLDQGYYVNGIAAGLSTRTNKLGFVASKPLGIVLRTLNAFVYGARKVNPDATVHVIFTGEWTAPSREAEASNALVDAGCDVLAERVDSPPPIIETAEARGIKCVGHGVSQAALAPNGFITGAEWKYETIFKMYAAMMQADKAPPNMTEGGYDKDYVQSTAFGAGATEEARTAATTAIEELKAGNPIFVGPVVTNQGRVISETSMGLYDLALWNMDYLVEGVVGTLP